MGYAVSNDLNGEPFSIADCLVPGAAITHYTRKLDGLSDPAPIFLPLERDRELHLFIIPPGREKPHPGQVTRDRRRLRIHRDEKSAYLANHDARTKVTCLEPCGCACVHRLGQASRQ
jgi:hypothetical protein